MIGQTLAHFRITGRLGAGGMGDVYRAEDLNLGREVAVKVLQEEFTGDPGRLARFKHEAKILASMNHPSIVAAYSLETVETPGTGESPSTTSFLVMELVEGHTLEKEIPAGGVPIERFFELAIPLAETLAAAHEHGIIHRDLKPANIMVTSSGSLKVLDFGLAKRQMPPFEPGEDTSTETMAQNTRVGQIVGTIPYMSPEQIRSGTLDQRSDIFSLGVVLFELIGGRRPFQGKTAVDLMSSILKEPPLDLGALRPEVSGQLADLIRRCLAKDSEARISSAAELGAQLSAMAKSTPSGSNSVEGEVISVDSTRRPELDPRAVAVLPFENLSRADEADFLALGLHNDLITELSKVPGLTVISRNSVLGFRETGKSAPQIGRELNAGTVIGGTVQSAGNRVRMTAYLIDAVADVHRWGERYDRELSPETLFAIQSELTQRIVESLHSKLGLDQELPVGKLQTEDLEAYRLNTLGRMQLDQRTESGIRRAVELFEQAVERDPDYVLAWVGLADALTLRVSYGFGKPDDLVSRAKDAGCRALELDPDSAEAHASLGLFYGTIQDGPASVRQSELAIQIKPSYADAHNWMSYWQNLSGRASEALVSAKRSVELNPLSAEAVSNLSLSFLTNREWEKAVTEADHVTELSPGWTTAGFFKGISLYELQRYSEARSALSDITVEWAGLGAEATLALTHVALNDENLARQVLEGTDPDTDAFAVGMVHFALGEVETGFDRCLSVDQFSDWPILAVHHLYHDVWSTVKDHPRFEELVRHAFKSFNLESPSG